MYTYVAALPIWGPSDRAEEDRSEIASSRVSAFSVVSGLVGYLNAIVARI